MATRNFLFVAVVLALATHGFAHTVKHIVVLMEENRSFDHLFGWASDVLHIDGLKGTESNPTSTLSANATRVYVSKNAPFVASCDPQHLLLLTTPKIFGVKNVLDGNTTSQAAAGMQGFVEVELDIKSKDACQVMDMFTPEAMPVLTQLAKSYAIMDRFFASVPGPTWPNRQFAMAATSGGSTETFNWFRGEVGRLFPQKTFFDQVAEVNGTWKNYYVDTPWELFMQTLADNPDNVQQMHRFYEDAASGQLPTYSFINPRSAVNVTSGEGSNDFHPDHDVRLAEAFVADVYNAIRASPSWNETLLVVTFDEHGGFYDHVSPPMSGIPPPDNFTAQPDWGFVFDRLGVRIPTLLISPWIKAGTVISAPPASMKPTLTSEYDLTSIMATARKILPGFESVPPLTKRDAWAATFHHVLDELEQPRTDCPATVGEGMPRTLSPAEVAREAAQPVNGLQHAIAVSLGVLSGVPEEEITARLASHTQGSIGSHLTQLLDSHRTMHREFVALVDEFAVWVTPIMEWYWIVNLGESHFTVQKTNQTTALGAIVTISGRQYTTPSGGRYCLDYRNASDNTSVLLMGASPCLGGTVLNREARQLWVWGYDATLRPYARQDLCVTTHTWSGQKNAVAEPCVDSVEQHWAQEGPAPGNMDAGRIMFGNGIYNLGWIPSALVSKALDSIKSGLGQ